MIPAAYVVVGNAPDRSKAHPRQWRHHSGQGLAAAGDNLGEDAWPEYSLFYGHPGERIVGYDNEAGKGDHRHYRGLEEPYPFTTYEKLLTDFFDDVKKDLENE